MYYAALLQYNFITILYTRISTLAKTQNIAAVTVPAQNYLINFM